MGNRSIVVKSDYKSGDVVGPFREATTSDTIVDGSGGIVSPESQISITSTTYSITDTYKNILLNATNNNIVATLPTAVGRTNIIFSIKRIDNSGYSVTISSSGGTMDGQTSIGMIEYSNYRFISNGTNWFII